MSQNELIGNIKKLEQLVEKQEAEINRLKAELNAVPLKNPVEDSDSQHLAKLLMVDIIMDNANVAITLMDWNGYFTFYNKLAEKYLRLTQDQTNTKSIIDLFPADGPGNLDEIRKVFINKQPVQIEANYHIEGNEHVFEISRIPLFDPNGDVYNVLSISREITEMKHAEKLARIQRSVDSLHSIAETYEESLHILFDNLFELEWLDAGGLYLLNYDEKILELIFHRGLSHEFIKRTLLYPFDSPNARVAFRKTPSYITKDSYLPGSIERLNQEKITFIASLPLVYKDKVLGLLNLASRHVIDISPADKQAIETIALKVSNLIELIKTRMELNRSNDELSGKLQELRVNHQIVLQKSRLESLGELLAGLAHEINQPLSIISLVMENVNYKLADKAATEEYLTHKFNTITNNINKIRELIDHVRIFSRDQGTIMFEQVNVNSVIMNALSMMQSQLRNRQIRVITELSDINGYTLGNPSRFEQVVLNLLSNARDALEEKDKKSGPGEKPMEISIKTTVDQANINILVRDNGSGISQENLDKIFNPFFTTKATGHGTGLGLPIVYGIIREMKGEIMARSEEGAFTEISISLPHFKINA
jgi:PAS domain S-box-containing protein